MALRRSYIKRGTSQLKRSGFSKTPTSSLKTSKKISKLPKPKLPSTKSLEKKVWKLCKKIVRLKYINNCYTCPATGLTGMNCQTGHGKPKGALKMKYKYDLRNLKIQCFNCNINLGGASDIFIAKLSQEKDGLNFLKETCVKTDGRWELKGEAPLGTTEAKFFLMELIEKYKKIIDDLSTK